MALGCAALVVARGAETNAVVTSFVTGVGSSVVPLGSKDPNTRVLGPKNNQYYGLWALKPHYFGPWTLRGLLGLSSEYRVLGLGVIKIMVPGPLFGPLKY